MCRLVRGWKSGSLAGGVRAPPEPHPHWRGRRGKGGPGAGSTGGSLRSRQTRICLPCARRLHVRPPRPRRARLREAPTCLCKHVAHIRRWWISNRRKRMDSVGGTRPRAKSCVCMRSRSHCGIASWYACAAARPNSGGPWKSFSSGPRQTRCMPCCPMHSTHTCSRWGWGGRGRPPFAQR